MPNLVQEIGIETADLKVFNFENLLLRYFAKYRDDGYF